MKKILLTICIAIFVLVFVFAMLVKVFDLNTVRKSDPIKDGIEITSPAPNSIISSPLKISGKVTGNGWIAFEAQTGTVRLFDAQNKELALGILTAKEEDWMKAEVEFESVLTFENPATKKGKLVFYNENPSGEYERERTFILPVSFR